jgi:hypothetical protein
MASITRFFDHPNKWMNLLFLGLCMLIPVVGPIVASGYCLVVVAHDLRRPGEMFPEFTFDNFVEYLKAGLWPFLVSLVVSLIGTPLGFCSFCPFFFAGALGDAGIFLGMCMSMVLHVIVILVIVGVTVPMMLRAGLEQNFGAAFKFEFVKDFITRMWKELLLAILFLMAVGVVGAVVGLLACIVGLYAVGGLMTFVSWQLYGQIYNLYLERGGATIEMSPELLALVEASEHQEAAGPDAAPPT